MNLLSERSQLTLIRLRTRVRRAVKANVLRRWAHLRTALRTVTKPDDPYDPEEPFALVTAPKRPGSPRRSGAVAVDPYEY